MRGLPINAVLTIDEEHRVQVQRRGPKKWHVFMHHPARVNETGFRDRKLNRIADQERARRQVVITVWHTGRQEAGFTGPEEYMVLLGGSETWFPKLETAIESAKLQLITLDAVKRLRGDNPNRP